MRTVVSQRVGSNSRSEEGRGILVHGYAGDRTRGGNSTDLFVHVPYRSRFTFFSALL